MVTVVLCLQFIDYKNDKVFSLQLEPRLHRFWEGLYDLLLVYVDVDVSLIYERLKPEFYDVLEDIHGDRVGDLERGHRLLERFPILKNSPSLDFVGRCIDHFVRILHVAQMMEDLQARVAEVQPDGSNLDISGQRIAELVRHIHLEKEAIKNTDIELADEAKELRRLGERSGSWKIAA